MATAATTTVIDKLEEVLLNSDEVIADIVDSTAHIYFKTLLYVAVEGGLNKAQMVGFMNDQFDRFMAANGSILSEMNAKRR